MDKKLGPVVYAFVDAPVQIVWITREGVVKDNQDIRYISKSTGLKATLGDCLTLEQKEELNKLWKEQEEKIKEMDLD